MDNHKGTGADHRERQETYTPLHAGVGAHEKGPLGHTKGPRGQKKRAFRVTKDGSAHAFPLKALGSPHLVK